MSPSVFDEAIKQLVHQPIDVCYTDILIPGFDRYAWNSKFQTRKWSRLVRAQRFKPIRNVANWVYMLMEEHRVYFPTVTLYNPADENGVPSVGLQLEWRDDDRVLTVFVANGHPLHYTRGRVGGILPVNFVNDLDSFAKLAPIVARFISPIVETGRADVRESA